MIKLYNKYLNEATTFPQDYVQIMSDLLNILNKIDKPLKTNVEKNCPAIKDFTNFVDNNEKTLLSTLQEKFAKATEKSADIKLTKEEKQLVQRIAVYVYKNAYTLDSEISALYRNMLSI